MKSLAILLMSLVLAAPVEVIAGPENQMADARPPAARERQEDRVVFYGNMTGIEPVMDAFRRKADIKGIYTRVSSSKFLSTVLAGMTEGRIEADVIQAPLPMLQAFKSKGLLSSSASSWQEWTGADTAIRSFGIECAAVIYNREQVRPGGVPKRYEDLANPRWRDRIVMPDPCSHETTLTWLVGLKEAVFSSEAAWRDFLHGVARNRPLFVPSFGSTPQPIESGDKWIGISLPKYIITRVPAPLDWAPRDQPLFGTPRGIAVAASAPHPHAARLFVDYWLSEEAMTLLAQKTGEVVLAPGIHPPIPGMDNARVLPLRELSPEEIRKWRDVFRPIFKSPSSAK